MPKADKQLANASLITAFESVATNLSAMYTAQFSAKRSEQETVQILEQLGAHNGLYLTPEDIPDDVKEQLTRTSLDAHLQKVQSEQITAVAMQQLHGQEQDLQRNFIGKKISLRAVDTVFKPFESAWTDGAGQMKTSALKTNHLKGIIDSILLEQNLLVLRPSLSLRLISPNTKSYLVHVINPETLTAAVSAV